MRLRCGERGQVRTSCSARALGWGVPLLRPRSPQAESPTTPLLPQSPEAAPASTRRDWSRGSATRGFGGTPGGDGAPGTAMATGGKTRGEKRLQTPCAPGRAAEAHLRGGGLRARLCGAEAAAAEGADAAAAAITAATSGAAAAAAVAEAAVGRFPLLRLSALCPPPPG